MSLLPSLPNPIGIPQYFSIPFFSSFLFFAKLILSLSCHKITSENTTSLQKKSRMTQTLRKTHFYGLETPVTDTQVVAHRGEGSGEITSRDRGENQPLFGGSQLALGQPQSQHQGEVGRVRECQPPKPSEGPRPTPQGGRAGGLAVAPGGDLEERVLPHVLFPNWIPSASSYRLPSCSERTPSPHIPASYTQLTQGTGRATHAKPRQPMAQGCPPTPHGPDPWPCKPSLF